MRYKGVKTAQFDRLDRINSAASESRLVFLARIGILLSPAVGALLMSVSTVIVAINAQSLRRAHFTA